MRNPGRFRREDSRCEQPGHHWLDPVPLPPGGVAGSCPALRGRTALPRDEIYDLEALLMRPGRGTTAADPPRKGRLFAFGKARRPDEDPFLQRLARLN